MIPPVYILLTTYSDVPDGPRTECARRTVRAIKNNLQWDNLGWWVSDDGSAPEHLQAVLDEIGGHGNALEVYNAARRGVGHGMNTCLRRIFERDALVIVMEDDWELTRPFELAPYVKLLLNHPAYGMVRFGYLAEGLSAETIALENRILWRLHPNNFQYRFTGHPSLRHARFHHVYGWYGEGPDYPPGAAELNMCGKVNANPSGPYIAIPAECGEWGVFGHTGGISLADIHPEQ